MTAADLVVILGVALIAALAWYSGVVLGAIMTFPYADLIVPAALEINANCYGWTFAGYLATVFTAAALAAGIVVRLVFTCSGSCPRAAMT